MPLYYSSLHRCLFLSPNQKNINIAGVLAKAHLEIPRNEIVQILFKKAGGEYLDLYQQVERFRGTPEEIWETIKTIFSKFDTPVEMDPDLQRLIPKIATHPNSLSEVQRYEGNANVLVKQIDFESSENSQTLFAINSIHFWGYTSRTMMVFVIKWSNFIRVFFLLYNCEK